LPPVTSLLASCTGTGSSLRTFHARLAARSRSRPRRNLSTLAFGGLKFAIFYIRVHDHSLQPLTVGDQAILATLNRNPTTTRAASSESADLTEDPLGAVLSRWDLR